MKKENIYTKKNAYRIVRKLNSKYVSLIEFRINAPKINEFYKMAVKKDAFAKEKIIVDLQHELEKLLIPIFFK